MYDTSETCPAGMKWADSRIFHTVSTDAAQSGISTALRLFGRLDILSNSLALPALRAPCIYARLRTLDTKRYEISGLTPYIKPHEISGLNAAAETVPIIACIFVVCPLYTIQVIRGRMEK